MLHRRDAMIRLGQLGLGSLSLPTLLKASVAPKPSARSCILLFLWGGPSQPDMWDLKPDAPEGIRSIYKPIDTVVPGVSISEKLPLSARVADKFTIIRSMSHESNNHEPSVYHTLTGRRNPTLVVPANARKRTDFPGVGALVSAFTPPGALPASVTIPQPIGHDGFNYAGTYGGFLGPRFDPMEMRQVTPASTKSEGSHSLNLPEELHRARLIARKGLLHLMDEEDRLLQKSGQGLDASRDLGSKLHVLFHPSAEGKTAKEARTAAVDPLPGIEKGKTSPDVAVVPVACCGKVPGLIQGTIRGALKKDAADTPVWLDFGSTMKDKFGLTEGESNLVVIDAQGRLRLKVNGNPDKETLQMVLQTTQNLRAEAAGLR